MSSDSALTLFSNSPNDSENIDPQNENIDKETDTSSLPDCSKNISHRSVLLDLLDPPNEVSTVCKICGGYARGVNYGVRTCDNCRGFFSHYLHRKKDLKCRKDNNCVIDKFTTIKCGKCRMDKCLRMGMSYNLKKVKNSSTCRKKSLALAQINKSCKVCGDVPIGIGYGVLSCGSCRMFFRRHDGTDVNLSCNKEGKCDLRMKFAKCPKCRMRKCLEVGMSTNSFVKPQRNLEVFKQKVETDLESKYTKAINEVVQNFELSCTYKEKDIESLAKSNFELTRFKDPLINRINGWQVYAPIIDFENHQTGLFVNRLPSIDSFEISDKAILFKRSSFLMFILRNITKFSSDGFLLPSNRHIPFRTMKTVYEDLMNEIILVSSDFKSMQLTHQELSLFTAFIFLRPITRGSQDWKIFIGDSTLKRVREYYRTLLYQLMAERESSQKIISDLATMTLKLYDLNKIHNDTIFFLQTNSKFMYLPPFLCEVYDLSKQGDMNEVNQTQDPNLMLEIQGPITSQTSLKQSKKVGSRVQNIVKLKANKKGNKPDQAIISYQHLHCPDNSKNMKKAPELKIAETPDGSSGLSDQPTVSRTSDKLIMETPRQPESDLSNPPEVFTTEINMESTNQVSEDELPLEYICNDLIPHFDEMDYSKYLELDPRVWYSGIVNKFSVDKDEGLESRSATPENII